MPPAPHPIILDTNQCLRTNLAALQTSPTTLERGALCTGAVPHFTISPAGAGRGSHPGDTGPPCKVSSIHRLMPVAMLGSLGFPLTPYSRLQLPCLSARPTCRRHSWDGIALVQALRLIALGRFARRLRRGRRRYRGHLRGRRLGIERTYLITLHLYLGSERTDLSEIDPLEGL